ncbi:MAG TPA: DUF6079 family protein [Polyangia bacterium]
MASPGAPLRLGDLVEIPELRTVVQLADLGDPRLRRVLLESFLLTPDAREHLGVILRALDAGRGQGFFLTGHFGTGKSHLLAMIALLAEDPGAWDALAAQDPGLAAPRERVHAARPLVVRVSLIEHAAAERLEDVVTAAAAHALGEEAIPAGRALADLQALVETRHPEELRRFLAEVGRRADELFTPAGLPDVAALCQRLGLPLRPRLSRGETTKGLLERAAAQGHRLVVLLLDELSEFLRAKPDGRAFIDEIRYLQHLGELGARAPLIVVGALQESLDAAGELAPETFNKIKDRYVRMAISAEHLEALVSQRLVRRRPGAEAEIARLARAFHKLFPGLAYPVDRLERLYPVHPATLDLLDDLRELFSRRRGVVDFVTAQLRGDPVRGIPGRLEGSPAALLGPDAVYDHFQPRILEEPAARPYHDVVYRHFEREAPALFPDVGQRTLALRALKLLILGALSPRPRPLTVRRLAEMLLHRASALDPQANYLLVRDLCQRLAGEGAFVTRAAAADPLDETYSVDYRLDAGLLARGQLAEAERAILPDDPRLFTRLALLCADAAVPLGQLVVQTETVLDVTWQGTRRQVRVLLRGLDELRGGELEKLVADVTAGDADAVIVLARALEVERQRAFLERDVLPRLGALGEAAASFVFWLPRPPGDPELLRRALALCLLGDRLRDDHTASGRAVRELFAERLKELIPRVSSLFAEVYLTGEVRFGAGLGGGPAARAPQSFGPLGFDQLAGAVAQVALDAAHPLHARIRPSQEPVPEQVQALLDGLLRPGLLDLAAPTARPLAALVEGVAAPLKLVRRERKQVFLRVDAAHSEIVTEYLARVREAAAQQPGGRARLADVARALRKGPYGLSRGSHDVLALALLCAGQLTAYTAGRRLDPQELSAHRLRQITELGFGEILDEEERALLRENRLVPARLREGTLTLPLQEEAWRTALDLRARTLAAAEQIRAHLDRARGFRSLAHLDLATLEEDLGVCAAVAETVDPELGSRAGLVRFSRAVSRAPHAVDAFRRLKAYQTFFGSGGLEAVVRVHEYLFDPGLVVPGGAAYDGVRERLEAAREAVRDRAALTDPDHGARLRAAFDAFLEGYLAVYRREHEGAMADPRFAALTRVAESEGYRALARLCTLPGLVVADDRGRVDRLLRGAREQQCADLRPEALLQRPRCRCGFALGARLELPEPEAVEAAIGRGLTQALGAFAAGRPRERLLAHAAALEQIGEAASARALKEFLGRPAPADPEAALAAARAVPDDLLGRLRDALRQELHVVERDLDRLEEELLDRSLPLSAAQQLFAAWLRGDGAPAPEGAFVRITSARRGPAEGAFGPLADAARTRFPDLAPLLRRGPRERGLLALAARVAGDHRLGDAAVLGALGAADAAAHGPALRALADEAAADGERFAALVAAADEEVVARGALALAQAAAPGDDPGRIADAFARERTFPAVLRALAARFLQAVDGAAALGRTIEPPPPVASPGVPAPVAALRAELGEALEAAARLAVVPHLAPPEGASARQWTRLYVEHLGRAGLDEATLAHAAARHALEDAAATAARAARLRAARHTLGRAFAAFYLERYPAWLRDLRGGPSFLDRALGPLRARWRTDLGVAAERVVLVDGLRWDAWLHLRERVLGTLGAPLRVLEEQAVWSRLPTTTAVNAHWLTQGAPPPAAPLGETEAGPEELADLALDDVPVPRLAALDDRLHHSRLDLRALYDEAGAALAAALRPIVAGAPPRSLLVLCADHGFVEAPDFDDRDPHARPRYRHGGATPWEVIVPLVAILRA